jgi:hypothetical protein
LDTEVDNLEAELAQSGSRRTSGQTGTYDDDVEATLIGGIYQLLMRFIISPFFRQGTFGYFRI